MIKFGPIQYTTHSVNFEPMHVTLLATFLNPSQIPFDIVRKVLL